MIFDKDRLSYTRNSALFGHFKPDEFLNNRQLPSSGSSVIPGTYDDVVEPGSENLNNTMVLLNLVENL